MEENNNWEAASWNAISEPSDDKTFKEVIDSLKTIAESFGIATNLEDVTITPLHYILHKYLPQDDDVIEQFIGRLNTIDPKLTNMHSLMRLETINRDQTKKEADSFLDGGCILLWCLYYNKNNLLQKFLSEGFVDFWRFAQLKTLLWACLNTKDKFENKEASTAAIQTLLQSTVMHQVFSEMPFFQKNDSIYYILQFDEEMQPILRPLLCEKPYTTAFVIERASIDNFKNLDDLDGYKIFVKAIDQILFYELEQIPEELYDQIQAFASFITIQDPDTEMFAAGIKYVNMLKGIPKFQAILTENQDGFDDVEPLEDEPNEMSNMGIAPSLDTNFRIDDFKKVICDTKEGTMLNIMMTSDSATVQQKKLLQEVLFVDWKDGFEYTYREQSGEETKAEPKEGEEELDSFDQKQIALAAAQKGKLNLSDCNLVHHLIARGFALDGSIMHLLDNFKMSGTVNNTDKNLPPCAIILNRNHNMNKGVSKILKMIAAVLSDNPEAGADFMKKHIPVGMLTSQNVISLFKFLIKTGTSVTPQAANYKKLLELLIGKRFFKSHLENSPSSQKMAFATAVEATRQIDGGELIEFINQSQNAEYSQRASLLTEGEEKGDGLYTEERQLLIDQIQGSGCTEGEFKAETFVEMLKLVSQDNDGGFDAKIRFPALEEELCPGQTQQRIFKVDVGPILLSLKAGNLDALKELLEKDMYVNLRESLAGPKDVYCADKTKPIKRWRYTFTHPNDITLSFENLGFALLADCELKEAKKHQMMLVQLLKQPSFVPEAYDFESFVTICLLKKHTLMLKTFLMSFQMHFIFTNLPYEKQRRITRLLLGLSPDGLECVASVFSEANITQKRPYLIFTLLEFLDNGKMISNPEKLGIDLLSTLLNDQLVLITYIDRDFIDSIVSTDQWLKKLKHSDIEKEELPASDELITTTQQIVNRIKQENASQGLNTDNRAMNSMNKQQSECKKMNPMPDDASDLEEDYDHDIDKKEIPELSALDISDD